MISSGTTMSGSCRGDQWNSNGWPQYAGMTSSLQECANACDNTSGCTSFESDPTSINCFLYGHFDVQPYTSPQSYEQKCYKKVPGLLYNHHHYYYHNFYLSMFRYKNNIISDLAGLISIKKRIQ